MAHEDSRFHALTNEEKGGPLLFARVKHDNVEILENDKAFQAAITSSHSKISGSSTRPSKELVGLLLSIPKTTARISSGDLTLRCTDKSTVQMMLTLPVTAIPAADLLSSLHSSLMLAAASLEGALLEVVGTEMSTEIAADTRESLDALHGPLITGGQRVDSRASFRRVAGADTKLHAARAFALGHAAENIRDEILEKRKERQRREKALRSQERDRLRIAKQLAATGERKRVKASIFDDSDMVTPGRSTTSTSRGRTSKSQDADVLAEKAPSTKSAQDVAMIALEQKEERSFTGQRNEGMESQAKRRKKRKTPKLV